MITEAEIIDGILLREGGYGDHPDDEGGPTKFGITLKTLERWRVKPCTAADVEGLTEREAREIYRSEYIHRPGFDLIPDDKLRVILVDTAVQWNPAKATRMLQVAVGAKEDGVLGPGSLAAAAAYGYDRAAIKVMLERIRRRGRRVTDHPSQSAFAAGWANRDVELLEELLA